MQNFIDWVSKLQLPTSKSPSQSHDVSSMDLESIGYIGEYDDLPDGLKDNKHLLTGYRIGFQGVKNGFKTMFMCHNETVNVWSHFMGKLFFLGLFFWILTCWPQMRSQADTFEA